MRLLVVYHQILNGIQIFINIGNAPRNQRFFEEYCDVAKIAIIVRKIYPNLVIN
jgi:hypothetical protein